MVCAALPGRAGVADLLIRTHPAYQGDRKKAFRGSAWKLVRCVNGILKLCVLHDTLSSNQLTLSCSSLAGRSPRESGLPDLGVGRHTPGWPCWDTGVLLCRMNLLAG